MFELRRMSAAARQLVGSAFVLVLAVMGSGSGLWAQSGSGQDMPRIEPRFTRIFGTDSMEIFGATMSPDGRWIAFTAAGHIWILPAAGGEPVRLTQGAYHPMGPVWFPGSERIAFLSDRPDFWAVMTLPIDNETGRPAGPPRQVTLEGSQAFFDVSPDGRWIAYTPTNERGNRVIRIVPSTGGTARTVREADTPVPQWAPDGQSLYYGILTGQPGEFGLVRVSLDGETMDTVFTWPGFIMPSTFPNTRYIARMVEGDHNGPTLWDLATLEGRSLARFSLPKGMFPGRFLKDGLAFLSRTSDGVAPIHILPVDGGPARSLTEGRAEDVPLAWLPNGERLLFRTNLDGAEVLLLAPVGGGAMRQFQLPDDAWWVGGSITASWTPDFTPVFSADGRHMFYAAGDPDAEKRPSTLKVLSLEDGRTWELSDAFHLTNVIGRGGSLFRDGEEFVYIEKRGDDYELRASPPEGPSRLVWSFGREVPGEVSVHGDRISFWKQPRLDETWLYTARAGQGAASELIRLGGRIHSLMWSPDGRWIAASHYYPVEGGTESGRVRAQVMFLALSPTGELVGGPRHVGQPSGSYWNNVWLPDSRGIVTSGLDLNVWLMPVDPDQSPVALTRDNPNEVYSFVLSPDGRHIAYSTRRVRGSSLWLVDLSEALQAGGS